MIQSVSVPVSASGARRPAAVLIVMAASVLLAAVWLVFSYGYLEDDAFIHLDFARSVAEGAGFAFDGTPTNGDTAPLWALALTLLHALGLDWFAAAKVACIVGLILAVGAVVRLLADLPCRESNRHSLIATAVAVTLLNPYFVRWSFSGMEAVAAFGVSVWIIWAVFTTSASWGKLALGALLIGAGPLLRPEFLLLGGLAGPVLLWKTWQLCERGSRTQALVYATGLTLLMVLPLAAWIVYALHAFGSIIPNTNLAKRGGSLLDLGPRLVSVYVAGFPVTLALLPFVAREVKSWRKPVAVLMLFIWPITCIAFYLLDHTVVQTRYCLVSMPCMSIAVLWLLSASGRDTWFRAAAVGMATIALLSTAFAVVPLVASKTRATAAYSAMSRYIRDHVPPKASVAVYAIGQVAFESGHPVVDIGGITRPAVIPLMSDPKATLRWAKEQGARYFIGNEGSPEPGAKRLFETSKPYLGWTLSRSRQQTTDALVLYELHP